MKDTKKELRTKIEKLQKAYSQIGNLRLSLSLAPDGDEHELFIKFIRLQNGIADLEDKLTDELKKIPWE